MDKKEAKQVAERINKGASASSHNGKKRVKRSRRHTPYAIYADAMAEAGRTPMPMYQKASNAVAELDNAASAQEKRSSSVAANTKTNTKAAKVKAKEMPGNKQ